MNRIYTIFLSLLILAPSTPCLSDGTYKPFALPLLVSTLEDMKEFRLRVTTLEFMLPSDFEVIDYRTGGGGPFYGRRSEIEEYWNTSRGTLRTPGLVKGVFEVGDRDRVSPAFDKTTKRFMFESAPAQAHGLPIETTTESMKRADTPSIPILLTKVKIVFKADHGWGRYWNYMALLALPDDSSISIYFHAPQPPTKMNEEIWERFAGSIRERETIERRAK